MKRFVWGTLLGFSGLVVAGALYSSVSSISAATVVERVKGNVILSVDGKGALWYVNPKDNKRYALQDSKKNIPWSQLYAIAKPVTEKELKTIPEGTASTIKKTNSGPVKPTAYTGALLRAETDLWYVWPADGRRYLLKDDKTAISVLSRLALGVRQRDVKTVPVGSGQALKHFASAAEFDGYVKSLQDAQPKPSFSSNQGALAVESPSMQKSADQPESITNVQEQGVDEGDIVKAYGDYLVVLRRGRLFTVRLRDGVQPILSAASSMNAYPNGLSGGAWYDEMLIAGNQVIVIGYRYSQSATEIGMFRVSSTGVLSHEATYFMDSDDYYSSRNYASRLVGGKLVFYMPQYLFRYGYDKFGGARREPKLPAMRKWVSGDKVSEDTTILSKVDIYKPIQDDLNPSLHTVVTCDLGSGLTCKAASVLGPSSRNFYVSTNAVYLWVSGSHPWYLKSEMIRPQDPDAYVYRISLLDGSATALKASGSPIDQFSFKEDADGHLNVVVRSNGRGEGMWRAERPGGSLSLLRVGLDQFRSDVNAVPVTAFTALTTPLGYSIHNRFIGDTLLYGAGGGYYTGVDSKSPERANLVYLKKYKTGDPVREQLLTHSVDRIEPMGDAALVVGQSNSALKFTSITLGPGLSVKDVYVLDSATQGEQRSHGFFYKPQADGSGILGIPIRTQGSASESLFSDSAQLLYLRVSQALSFTKLGSLAAHPPTRVDDVCVVSCADWYGNARPIFYGGRIFALMGYEMVEGSLSSSGNVLSEARRLLYLESVPAQ